MKSQPQRLDGEYVEAGTWNGKPKYKQRDGPGVIFYEGTLGATKTRLVLRVIFVQLKESAKG